MIKNKKNALDALRSNDVNTDFISDLSFLKKEEESHSVHSSKITNNDKIGYAIEILRISIDSKRSIFDVVSDFEKCFRKIDSIVNKIESNSLDKKNLTEEEILSTISDDFIVCLEDGMKYQSLTRHLSSKYGLTPNEYRSKWGLPDNYPMVAKNYTQKRKKIITEIHSERKSRRG